MIDDMMAVLKSEMELEAITLDDAIPGIEAILKRGNYSRNKMPFYRREYYSVDRRHTIEEEYVISGTDLTREENIFPVVEVTQRRNYYSRYRGHTIEDKYFSNYRGHT